MPVAPEQLSAIAQELSAYPNIWSAWLFGSRSKGQENKDSDFDIALLCDPKLQLDDYLQLQWDLVPVLGSDRIDLVDLQNANPILRFEAISGIEILRRDEERHLAFCSLTSRVFADANHRLLQFANQRASSRAAI